MKNSRLSSIDLLRTIAIIIMIIANSSPYILALPHSIGLRIISSLAAPLFIFLSGYSFFVSFHKKQNYKHKYIQIFYLFISAMLLDALVWHIRPLHTFDVLYLIAFGLVVNTIIFKLKLYLKLIIAILFISASFLLQTTFDYRFSLPDPVFDEISLSHITWSSLFEIKRFLMDGWFPLFPWVGIAILGQIMAAKSELIAKHKNILIGVCSFLFFFLGYFVINQESSTPERQGYLEVFYPPSILFLTFALSFIILLLALFNTLELINLPKYKIISILGRNSLLMYIFHSAVISYVFQNYFTALSPVLFTSVMLIFILTCVFIAFLAEWAEKKGKLKFVPGAIKSILGLK
jgi:uncharacterized membrane protein